MFDKGVTGNNLMMTLYFSCLQECTELLVGIFSLAAFLKRLFQRWPWQTGSNTYIIFHCIFSIFLYLNRSSISVTCRFFHTYNIQLICDNVLFTLLNITDHSVVIDKLQQDKSGQALFFIWRMHLGAVNIPIILPQADNPAGLRPRDVSYLIH